MTFLTLPLRPSGCRGIPSLREPFQIALSTEKEWAVAWTRRSAVVLSRCHLTFSSESTHSCGGGNSTVASSTTHVLMCLSRTKLGRLACHPLLVCLQLDRQLHHPPIVVVTGLNAVASDGADLLVVHLGLLAKSPTLGTHSAFLALPRHRRHRHRRRRHRRRRHRRRR